MIRVRGVRLWCLWGCAVLAHTIGCAGAQEATPTSNASAEVRDPVAPGTDTPSRPPSKPHPTWVEVRTSLIPNAGKGLFAKVDMPVGTYIGPYTGRYITADEYDNLPDADIQYVFEIPECAKMPKYEGILGNKEHYVSKVNYAPEKINGYLTKLQNVEFDIMCKEPLVRLYTSRAVRADEELYVDYGENYDYFFMAFPEVQNHFLGRTGIPKMREFNWDYGDLQ